MKPGAYDLTLYCGTTLDGEAVNFAYKMSNIAVDLSGYSARAQCRSEKGHLLFDWSTDNGRLVITPLTGQIAPNVSAEETAALYTPGLPIHAFDNGQPLHKLGTWQMELTSGAGRVIRLLQGLVLLSPEQVYG